MRGRENVDNNQIVMTDSSFQAVAITQTVHYITDREFLWLRPRILIHWSPLPTILLFKKKVQIVMMVEHKWKPLEQLGGKFYWHPLRFASMTDTLSRMRNDYKLRVVSIFISPTPNEQLFNQTCDRISKKCYILEISCF